MTDIVVRSWFHDTLRAIFTTMGVNVNRNVAWPGKPTFESTNLPDEEDWWRLSFIIPQPGGQAIGLNAPNRYHGVAQIDLFSSLVGDVDEMQHLQKVDLICRSFRKGVQFVQTGLFCVSCEQSYIAASTHDPASARWQVSVRVRFNADIIN